MVDGSGSIIRRGARATDPQVLEQTFGKRRPQVARTVLETGALSAFLYHGLVERGVPTARICARHAMGVLDFW